MRVEVFAIPLRQRIVVTSIWSTRSVLGLLRAFCRSDCPALSLVRSHPRYLQPQRARDYATVGYPRVTQQSRQQSCC